MYMQSQTLKKVVLSSKQEPRSPRWLTPSPCYHPCHAPVIWTILLELGASDDVVLMQRVGLGRKFFTCRWT